MASTSGWTRREPGLAAAQHFCEIGSPVVTVVQGLKIVADETGSAPRNGSPADPGSGAGLERALEAVRAPSLASLVGAPPGAAAQPASVPSYGLGLPGREGPVL